MCSSSLGGVRTVILTTTAITRQPSSAPKPYELLAADRD